jgi:formylglycine-generating enzyme required for sulfatase activity
MLDPELRLITPTDAEGLYDKDLPTRSRGQYYQLAHDYLVHSLRDWLTRKQRETRRGRAELRLSEWSASWNAKSEKRHSPSLLEWAIIRSLTRKRNWSEVERRMMKRAGRSHGLRSLALATVAALLAAAGLHLRNRFVEANQAIVATGVVRQIVSADTANVPNIIRAIKPSDRRWTDPELRQLVAIAPENSNDKLHASLALLPVDPSQVEYLYSRLLGADPRQLPVIRKALDGHQKKLVERLWAVLDNTQGSPNDRFAAACGLASYAPGENAQRWLSASSFISEQLLTQVIKNPSNYALLLETLRPIHLRLLASLSATFRNQQRSETDRSFATYILADYARDQPAVVADLLMTAGSKEYEAFFPIAQGGNATTVPLFQDELAKRVTFSWDDRPLEPSRSKPDEVLVNKIESAGGLLAERFAFCQAMPLGDFLAIVERLRTSGYRPIRLRPYADCQTVRVAAVWTRDGRPSRLVHDESSAEIRRIDELYRREGFLPVDIAGYQVVDSDGEPRDRIAALWVEKGGPDDDARMIAAMSAEELQNAQDQLKSTEMAPATLVAFRDGKERTTYYGTGCKSTIASRAVCRNNVAEGKFPAELALRADLTLIDLSVSVAAPQPATEEHDLAAPRAAAAGPKPKPDDPNARFATMAGHMDRSYAAVWSGDVGLEGIPIFGLNPADHLKRCRELALQGYRMISISVVRIRPDAPPVTASVWHRPVADEQATDRLAQRQARAAIALIRMGKAEEVWPLLRHSADPRLRSFIINWLNPLGTDLRKITAELDRLDSRASGHPTSVTRESDAILFHPEISIRRALILAPGTYRVDALSSGEREPMIAKLLELYRNDPDAGIQGAAEWTLRQWNEHDKLKAADAALVQLKDRGDRRWMVNSQGQTFALIEGPVEFRMGSPATEPDRYARFELPHRRVIPRRFAIAAKEVTVADYQEFVKENPEVDHATSSRLSPDPRGPMNRVSWFHAVAYCNWLSRKENLPVCYDSNPQVKYPHGMKTPADALRRTGYRLPTEAEWEYACRSGALTSRYFGMNVELLGRYAWSVATSQDHAWPCGSLLPNDLGLFDFLGNVYEWCHDPSHSYRPDQGGIVADDVPTQDSEGTDGLLRGMSFVEPPRHIRSAGRGHNAHSNGNPNFGFRIARTCD